MLASPDFRVSVMLNPQIALVVALPRDVPAFKITAKPCVRLDICEGRNGPRRAPIGTLSSFSNRATLATNLIACPPFQGAMTHRGEYSGREGGNATRRHRLRSRSSLLFENPPARVRSKCRGKQSNRPWDRNVASAFSDSRHPQSTPIVAVSEQQHGAALLVEATAPWPSRFESGGIK